VQQASTNLQQAMVIARQMLEVRLFELLHADHMVVVVRRFYTVARALSATMTGGMQTQG
jgi:hypothetical protein